MSWDSFTWNTYVWAILTKRLWMRRRLDDSWWLAKVISVCLHYWRSYFNTAGWQWKSLFTLLVSGSHSLLYFFTISIWFFFLCLCAKSECELLLKYYRIWFSDSIQHEWCSFLSTSLEHVHFLQTIWMIHWRQPLHHRMLMRTMTLLTLLFCVEILGHFLVTSVVSCFCCYLL